MFVLQECSICFEDYDAERQPHSIPCGHVFCQPCLESLVSTSPQCPNCRVSYESNSIRKVICTLQEQGSSNHTSTAEDSEAETLMWQAIQSAIESPQDLKQRKSVVQNNPQDALLAAGMPKNVVTALEMMRLLVQVEENNSSLKDKLNTCWAVEESLRDQISRLETKLNLAGTNTCTSSEHFKPNNNPLTKSVLLADVHKLQSVIEVINKNTSEVFRHLNTKPEPPTPQARSTETSERRPIPPPAPIPVPEPVSAPILRNQSSRPGILRKSPPQDTSSSTVTSPMESPTVLRVSLGIGSPLRQDSSGPTHHRYPSTPTPTTQLMSPPMTPAVLPKPLEGPPLFGQTSNISHPRSSPISRHLSMASIPTPHKIQMGYLTMPTPTVPLNTTNPNSAHPHPRPPPTPTPTQPSSSHSFRNTTLPSTPRPATAPTPKPQRQPRTLTAIFDFSASSSTELSLKKGQKLHLLPESDTNKEWIWCRDENGTTGYAPRSYVTVEGS